MSEPVYDRKDQLRRIQGLLIDGETLHAVYDLKGKGTGFVGITDQRLIFMDEAFWTDKKAMVSLPFSRINAVASEDSGQVLLGSILGSSKLTIVAGMRQWEFEFRSDDKAHEAYKLIMGSLLRKGVG